MRVVQTLVDAGHAAYFAGGCVRDELMGLEPDDYDVATDARPEQVADIFHRTQAVGESFGVMLVRLMGHTIQVATFRTDGVYSDGRHPDEVHYSDAEHDARRRDFTINGLFEDPLNDRIIDYVDGRADMDAQIIRAIDEPERRFSDDHLRMLRAVRFAARFGYAIEGETADAIRRHASNLEGVSRERIGQEVKRMFCDRNRAVAGWEMQYLGLDGPVLSETHSMVAPTRLGRLPDDAAFATALAAWLLDRHEAATGGDGDPAVMTRAWFEVASRWAQSLVLSIDERADLRACLRVYALLRTTWPTLGVAAQKRLAARPAFNEALLILQAVDRQGFVDVRRQVGELSRDGLAPTPLITGDDLIRLGLTPGPQFKQLLDWVYDAQLEGAIETVSEAEQLAVELARQHGRDRTP